jgi:outer membrane protein assembly factor BamB
MFAAVLLMLAAAPVPKSEAADWKAVVKSREFQFDPAKTGEKYALASAKDADIATAEFTPDGSGAYSDFTFAKKVGPKVTLHGHALSAVAIQGDALYFADFGTISTGCRVVAYDLSTGKKVWSQNLEGIGPVAHRKYPNRIAMAVEKHPTAKDAFALVITGWEAYGAYYEVIDLAAGKQLANWKFDPETAGLPRP